MATQKILIVDDERKIVDIIRAYLDKNNFTTYVAYDGSSAMDIMKAKSPDLIILDLMLPGMSGWDICRELRKTSQVPIIMLTARDEVEDKIVGLELGADDYLTKPFNPNELVSRVRAILRRTSDNASTQNLIRLANITLDQYKRTVFRDEKAIELTPTEFDLLSTMAKNPGRVYTRIQLLDILQGEAYEGYERTIDSHVKNLRKKIEPNPDKPIYILTVHGVGYKLEDKYDK
ncbi:MAG TPA: response regulator transcription factor [Dehalococcoidia bacterium]|nr:response regulator transcription factor [Dehalococcoidia bacterium]